MTLFGLVISLSCTYKTAICVLKWPKSMETVAYLGTIGAVMRGNSWNFLNFTSGLENFTYQSNGWLLRGHWSTTWAEKWCDSELVGRKEMMCWKILWRSENIFVFHGWWVWSTSINGDARSLNLKICNRYLLGGGSPLEACIRMVVSAILNRWRKKVITTIGIVEIELF